MANSVGQIGLDLVVNSNQFNRQMAGINSMAKKAGAALAGAFAVKKIVEFGASCVELGSDLAEVQNVVDVSFPAMSAQVDKFAKNAAGMFGLSETMAKKFTGTFGAMAKAFGFSEKASYGMSTALTGLAGDVASFYNISQDEAYTKLKSVFTGETETLKDLGVVMTQNALDAYAMSSGLGKTTQQMSESEKVALRYKFVMDQLSLAQGDFARTSDSWANQTRILKLQFDSIKATLGQGFINLFTPILKSINALLGRLGTLANAFKAFTGLITGKKSTSAAVSGMGDLAGAASDASTGVGGVGNSMAAAGKKAKKATKDMKSLMGFDQVNKISKEPAAEADTGSSGGSAGGGGGASTSPVDYGSMPQGDGSTLKLGKEYDTLRQSIGRLKSAFGEFAGVVKGAFAWVWNNVLKPFGKWTITKLTPKLLDVLAAAFRVLTAACRAVAPIFTTLWDVFFEPLAKFTGKVILKFLELLAGSLNKLADWINENPEKFRVIVSTLMSLLALKKVIGVVSKFKVAFLNAASVITTTMGLGKKISIFGSEIMKMGTKATRSGEKLTLFGKIGQKIKGFGGLGGSIGKLKTKMVDLVKSLAGADGPIRKIPGAFKSAASAAVDLSKQTAILAKMKAKDIAQTIRLGAVHAKDFAVSVAKSAASVAKQTVALVASNAAKLASATAQVAMTVATTAWTAICTLAATVTTALGAAFTFLTGPIGLVVVAIAAAIAIGVLLYKNWDKVKAGALNAWNAIKDGINAAIERIKEVFGNIVGWFKEKYNAIKNVFVSVGAWFSEKFKAAYEAVKNAFAPIGAWFKEKYTAIKNVFISIGSWFGEKFRSAYTAVRSAFAAIGTWFKDRYTSIKNVFSSVASWFGEKFRAAWSAITKPFQAVGGFFNGIWRTISSKFKGIGTKIGDAIGGSFKSAINAVLRTVERGINWVPRTINKALGLINELPGVTIPYMPTISLPRLAQGGYVKANTPQLAMIGDNRHQGEVVAPEDKLRQMAMDAVRAAGGSGGVTKADLRELLENMTSVLVSTFESVGIYVDSEEIAKLADRGRRKMNRRYSPIGE